jgi:hypothetical protein
MRRPIFLLLSGLLASALLVLAGCGGSPASPFTGTWKVTALPAGREITMWLVKIEPKGDGLRGTVLAAGLPPLSGATVEDVRADGDALNLTVEADGQPYVFVFRRAGGGAEPAALLGSAMIRGERNFARLERTDLKALDEKQAMVVNDPTGELDRARREPAGPTKEAALRKVIEHHAGRTAEFVARLALVEVLAARGDEAEARDQADRAAAMAALYGPEAKRQALAFAALASAKLPAVAVDYARQAEQVGGADVPPEEQLALLKVLARALRGAGKEAEARGADERVAKAEEAVDRAYEEKAVPFPTPPFAGRGGKSERVVLVELFTGANCGPCIAADTAFDALLRTYTPRDVVLVQYHEHSPSADPLTNHDGERRANYYHVPGTPVWFVNGRAGPQPAGPRELAREGYTALLSRLQQEMETEAPARLKVSAGRQGERVDVTAEVDGLKGSGAARLRLLLVEDVVRYTGSNRQRLHHHVVRAAPGGIDGKPVGAAPARQEATVNLAELRKSLRAQLAEHAAFKEGEWPLELKRLKVVALVQDDQTREVLQAAQADVPEG